MKELAIKTHKFEKSKNELKKFSEQSIKDIELRKVEVAGGFLWLGNHKVTGDELNELTADIQKHLIKNNEFHTKFIKEFGQVYQALEALDKEYIQAILMAIKSSEKANEDVKIAQKDIGKTIELQKKTILALKTFKENIEKYEHLKDIDQLWDVSLEHKSCLQNVSDQLNEYEQTMSMQKEILNKHEEKVNLQSEKTLDQAEYLEQIFQQNSEQAEQISMQAGVIENLESIIKEMQEVNNEKNIQTCKKMKFAFGLAGGAMFLVILEFILIMTGVV